MDLVDVTRNEAPYSFPLFCSSCSVFFNWTVLTLNAAGFWFRGCQLGFCKNSGDQTKLWFARLSPHCSVFPLFCIMLALNFD